MIARPASISPRQDRIDQLVGRSTAALTDLNELVKGTLAAMRRDLAAESSEATAALVIGPLEKQFALCKQAFENADKAAREQGATWSDQQIDEAEISIRQLESAVQLLRAALERSGDEGTH